jgi:hypothetical protein
VVKHTRENSGLRLDRSLHWWHDGVPVEHPKIIAAFNRGLTVDDDGRYKLIVGKDWCYVEVEDAGYAVERVNIGPRTVDLDLSDGSTEPLDPALLTIGVDDALGCRVKQGKAKARFSRTAQVELGVRISQAGTGWVLVLDEVTHPLPFTP